MDLTARQFFNKAEQEQVCETVHRAEKKTTGEIVPMLIAESNPYPVAVMRGGILIAALAALLLTPAAAAVFWLGPANLWVFLALFILFYLVVQGIMKYFPALKRYFLFKEEIDEEVRETAFAAFYNEGLYQTKDANGILIFISLLERRAWILADHGINKKIPDKKWDETVKMITRGIRKKEACTALCHAIDEIGDFLSLEFPIQENDVNELHDLIIR